MSTTEIEDQLGAEDFRRDGGLARGATQIYVPLHAYNLRSKI